MLAFREHIFDPDGDVTFVLEAGSRHGHVVPQPPALMETQIKTLALDDTNNINSLKVRLYQEGEVRCTVSSKHMILASRVFKAMLQGPLLEGETLRATGKVEIPLPEDDLVAFTILLYIIHGKTSQVPRTISVELLATLSILVDKYELLEVVGIYSDVWILANYRFRKIELAVPDDIDLLWLSISWVFRKEEIFENITKVMIRNSSQIHIEKMVALLALNDFELPIPPEVFNTMNSKRAVLTRAAINYVQFFVTRYTSSEHIHCDAKPPQDPLIPSDPETHIAQRLACDAMVLGTLTKSCASMRFSPDSSPPGLFALRKPYSAVSCKEVLEQISAMKVESLCDRLCPRIGQDPGHRVKETLHEILRNNVCFKGLDLKDFVVKGR